MNRTESVNVFVPPSSPVIITLDSDSSRDAVVNNNNSGSSSCSSSPLSSQPTVDFSHLPPLPLLPSAAAGQALTAEIGELPVDILDRGSEGSDTEPAGRSQAASPIAIDCSDHDVDVETVENGSLLGSDDDKGLVGRAGREAAPAANQGEAGAEERGSRPAEEGAAAPTATALCRDSEVSDSHLLATILNDLKGIAAPTCGLSLSLEPSSSSRRKQYFRDQCEVNGARSDQDSWLAGARQLSSDLPEQRPSTDSRHLPASRTSTPSLPSLEQLKDCRVREEGKDLPPLLKQASPVRSYNRNTPPPLKHKDAVSPHLVSPADLLSPHHAAELHPNSTSSPTDSSSRAIPPISTLKRHFTSTLAVRGEAASDRRTPSCRLTPTDSGSAAPSQVGASGFHTTLKPPVGCLSGSESRSFSTECSSHPDLNAFRSSQSHSSRHPVNSLSSIVVHPATTDGSEDKSAHTDSTSRGCRNKTGSPDSCQGAPIDLHPASSVSAGGTAAAADVFSGVNCHITAATGFVPTTVTGTESRSEMPSPPRVSSVSTTAASIRSIPSDTRPRSPTSTPDLPSCAAALEGLMDNKVSPLILPEEGLPHGHLPVVDSNCTGPANTPHFASTTMDPHSHHAALSTAHEALPAGSHQHNCWNSSSHPQLPTNICVKHHLPFDSQCESQQPSDSQLQKSGGDWQPPAANHIASSPSLQSAHLSQSLSHALNNAEPAASGLNTHTSE